MTRIQVAWLLWFVGAALTLLSDIHAVSKTTGDVGFVIALAGGAIGLFPLLWKRKPPRDNSN
jgi:hypothetical protein